MPIEIFSLPQHVRDGVIKKLDFPDFVNFHQCSQNAIETANNVKTRFTIDKTEGNDAITFRFQYTNQTMGMQIHKSVVELFSNPFKPIRTDFCNFPVRFEGCQAIITENFSEQFCTELTKFIERTNCSLKYLSLYKVSCSPEALKRLVETENVKELRFNMKLSPEYLKIDRIRNISKFVILSMKEFDILAFNAPKFRISLSNLSSTGINQMLKELLSGGRAIKDGSICTNQPLNKAIVFEGIPILSSSSSFGSSETILIGSDTTYKLRITYGRMTRITIREVPRGFVQNPYRMSFKNFGAAKQKILDK